MPLLKDMQSAASAGAATMLPEAASELRSAILLFQQKGGGFCGLDGKPDLYYTFFARLSLLAMGAEYDRFALIGWTRSVLKNSSGVDRVCAELILLQEGARSRTASRLYLLGSLLRIRAVDSYKLFLTAFLMEALLSQWLCQMLIRHAASATLKQRAHTDFNSLSTPRAAVCALLAHRTGNLGMQQRMAELLRQRHQASGGYASAAGARADLLSTAVVLFTGSCLHNTQSVSSGKRKGSNVYCVNTTPDLAFIEMCWQDDGLFSSAPDQVAGDLEHTFYALLALGCA